MIRLTRNAGSILEEQRERRVRRVTLRIEALDTG
jgi:hypothetical protein